jgi:hypothetical protein
LDIRSELELGTLMARRCLRDGTYLSHISGQLSFVPNQGRRP